MLKDPSNTHFHLARQFVEQTSQHVFVTGRAGTGKTTFLKSIRDKGAKKMAVVAPTGVAAINAGGVTLHSFFQLPFGPFVPSVGGGRSGGEHISSEYELLKNVRLNSAKRELLRELELLVIDEVSMLRADTLDAIDCVLRHIRQQPLFPFGGVQMLYIGDLFQLPPVVNPSEWEILRPYYSSAFFFDARALQNAPPLYLELKKIYRQNEAAFIRILDHVRNNQATPGDLDQLHRRYDPSFQPDSEDNYITLTTHNARAESINQQQLAKLPAELRSFEGVIRGEFSEKALPAEKTLYLKPGAQIMFIKNDKGDSRRYFNGKIGQIQRIQGDEIVVRFPEEEAELSLEKETWRNIRYSYNREKDKIEEEELGTFSQYPVRLAWAITIHKSQGLTFTKAIIDAGASFSPGQVYVALSRLTSMEGMVLYSRIHPSAIQTDQRVLAFTQSEMAEQQLRDRLSQDQLTFAGQHLIQSFNWNALVARVEELSETSEELAASARKQTPSWYGRMRRMTMDQQAISEKFTREIEQLLLKAEREGFGQLFRRISAAQEYFTKALDEQLVSVQQRAEALRLKPSAKKRFSDVQALEASLVRKRQQLYQAFRMAEGLMNGADLTDLLQIAEQKVEAPHQPDSPTSTLAGNPKPEKGETVRISLQLYLQDKSIAQIADLRAMAASTIERHLSTMVYSGDLHISKMVAPHKIRPALEVIDQTGSASLKKLKDKLGSAYSYAEIRALVSHWRKSKGL
jgi:PIF1-like helicase/Helix-turn-helix domain/Helicase